VRSMLCHFLWFGVDVNLADQASNRCNSI
jgi:hypothetical protein